MILFLSFFSISASYTAQYGNNTLEFKANTTQTIQIPDTFTIGPISINSNDYSNYIIFHNPALFTSEGHQLNVLYKNLSSIEVSTIYDSTLEFTVLCIKKDQCDYVNTFINTINVIISAKSMKDKQICNLFVSSRPAEYNLSTAKDANIYYYNKSMATEFQNQIPENSLIITSQYFIVYVGKEEESNKVTVSFDDFIDKQRLDPFYVGGIFHYEDSENNYGSNSLLSSQFYQNPPIASKSKIPVGRFVIEVPQGKSLTLDVPENHLIVPINNFRNFLFEAGKNSDKSGNSGSVARFITDGWVKFTNKNSSTNYLTVVSYKLKNNYDCKKDQSSVYIGSTRKYLIPLTYYDRDLCYFVAFGTNLGFSMAYGNYDYGTILNIYAANESHKASFSYQNREPYFIRFSTPRFIGIPLSLRIESFIPKSQDEGNKAFDYNSDDFMEIGNSISRQLKIAITVVLLFIITLIVTFALCCCICLCKSRSSLSDSSSQSHNRRRNYAQPGYPASYMQTDITSNTAYQPQYYYQQQYQGDSQQTPENYQQIQSPYTPATSPYEQENEYPET